MTFAVASTSRLRADFPALERRHAGHPVAYFDGPGGTQVPAAVAHAVHDHLLAHNANAGWQFPTSLESAHVAVAARRAAADFVGGLPEGVVFGPNMTSLTWMFARALTRALAPGDEIVLTRLDHRANVDPWRRMAEARDLVVRTVPFGSDGYLEDDHMAAAIGKRTRVVAVTAAANAIGSVVDVAAVAAAARAVGALVYVDAVHSAAHLRTDVARLGCDALVCSPYKFYGPHAGVLWAKPDLLARLAPQRLGPAPADGPPAWESGTPAYEAMAGTTAAIDWLAGLAEPADAEVGTPASASREAPAPEAAARSECLDATFAALHERSHNLTVRLWDGLAALEGVRLFGPVPSDPRTPTVAFAVRGTDAAGVARHLAERFGVFVSHGNFYAPDVLTDLGIEDPGGLVRAGCACYTTGEEVDRLVAGVSDLL